MENYQKLMEKEIGKIKSGIKPKLLLHSCCAPCSSYVLEYLNKIFEITVFYYNPNISPEEEYRFRADEQKRLIKELKNTDEIHFVEGQYLPLDFFEAVKGHEGDREGGARCGICFDLRLDASAKYAAERGFDYFTTTLSISPLKNAEVLNSIMKEKSEKYGIKNLPSDFKKREGYKRSIELSKEYNLYRQNYCGCIFSKSENKTTN